MSAVVAYFLGVVTVPAAVLAWAVQHDARKTGREWSCPRHDWSSGPIRPTPRWKAWARWRTHAVRYHRHGIRWDFQ